MDNPPPHYPQLARAWTVSCMNKVSLPPDPELTTPALELLILFPKLWALKGQNNLDFTARLYDTLVCTGLIQIAATIRSPIVAPIVTPIVAPIVALIVALIIELTITLEFVIPTGDPSKRRSVWLLIT